jgi:hypothetical protein
VGLLSTCPSIRYLRAFLRALSSRVALDPAEHHIELTRHRIANHVI